MSLLARKIRLIMKLRKAGITDTAVLSAIERVPREAFLPEESRRGLSSGYTLADRG